jgi:hypothetical protein
MWNGRTSRYADAPTSAAAPSDVAVSPDVTQVILEKVQQTLKSNYPLETLYIKSTDKGVYDCRFMFFNTDGYYGTQYDVSAMIRPDGGVDILSRSETAVVGDAGNPAYVPDQYQAYSTIEANLDMQLKDALKQEAEKKRKNRV